MLGFLKNGGWVAILAAVGLALGWFRSEMKAAEQRGQALMMAEQAEVAFAAILDSIDGAWAERAQVWDSTQQALTTELATQGATSRAATASALEAAGVSRQVLENLRDSLSAVTLVELDLVAVGLDRLEEANVACDVALGTCEELVEQSSARIYDLEAQFEQALAANRQQALTVERLQDVRAPRTGTVGYVGWGVAVLEGILLILQALGG